MIIDIIIEYFEEYLKSADWGLEHDSKKSAFGTEGMRLYGEILPSLWW